jgi:hypothetical protein
VSGTVGTGAPRGTPEAIITTLNKEINACLADLKLRARLPELGTVEQKIAPIWLAMRQLQQGFAGDETGFAMDRRWCLWVKNVVSGASPHLMRRNTSSP